MRFLNYYNLHVRSILVSKFYFNSLGKVTDLGINFLKLGVKKNKLGFCLGFLFLFLISNKFPSIFLGFLSQRKKKRLNFFGLKTNFSKKQFFNFLDKLTTCYLPFCENWAGALPFFHLKVEGGKFVALKFPDLNIFLELDFLVLFNYIFLNSLSKKLFLHLYLSANPRLKYQKITLLRLFQLPLINSF